MDPVFCTKKQSYTVTTKLNNNKDNILQGVQLNCQTVEHILNARAPTTEAIVQVLGAVHSDMQPARQ